MKIKQLLSQEVITAIYSMVNEPVNPSGKRDVADFKDMLLGKVKDLLIDSGKYDTRYLSITKFKVSRYGLIGDTCYIWVRTRNRDFDHILGKEAQVFKTVYVHVDEIVQGRRNNLTYSYSAKIDLDDDIYDIAL